MYKYVYPLCEHLEDLVCEHQEDRRCEDLEVLLSLRTPRSAVIPCALTDDVDIPPLSVSSPLIISFQHLAINSIW